MKQKLLSSLEQEIMNIVWELKECSVRDVIGRIDRTNQLAYTTIATILQRLHTKGLVHKRLSGSAFAYSPRLTKEAYGKSLAKAFVNRFFSSFGDVAISSFAHSLDSLPKRKRDYLLRLLETDAKTK